MEKALKQNNGTAAQCLQGSRISSEILYYVLGVLYCILVFRNLPPVYDDYLFASYHFGSFSEMFQHALYYGNGRLLGNLISIFIVTVPGADVVTRALILPLLPILVCRLPGLQNSLSRLLFTLVFLGMPATLFAQTICWATAFANYGIPLCFGLLAITLLLDRSADGFIYWMMLFLLGIAAQLFMEPNTILHTAVAAMMALFYWRTADKRKNKAFSLFAGCILGMLMMVLIPRTFYDPANTVEGYREISALGALAQTVKGRLKEYLDYIAHFHLLLLLLSGCIYLYLRFKTQKVPRAAILAGTMVCPAACILLDCFGFSQKIFLYGIYAMILLWIGLYGWALIRWPGSIAKNVPLLLAAAAVLAFLPLLVVSRSVERCLLLPYVLMAASCLSYLIPELYDIDQKYRQRIISVVGIGVAVLLIYLGSTFLQIQSMTKMRDTFVEREYASGATTIPVFTFPQAYVHRGGDSCLDLYYYYQEPGDIAFPVMRWTEWQRQYGGSVF